MVFTLVQSAVFKIQSYISPLVNEFPIFFQDGELYDLFILVKQNGNTL